MSAADASAIDAGFDAVDEDGNGACHRQGGGAGDVWWWEHGGGSVCMCVTSSEPSPSPLGELDFEEVMIALASIASRAGEAEVEQHLSRTDYVCAREPASRVCPLPVVGRMCCVHVPTFDAVTGVLGAFCVPSYRSGWQRIH